MPAGETVLWGMLRVLPLPLGRASVVFQNPIYGPRRQSEPDGYLAYIVTVAAQADDATVARRAALLQRRKDRPGALPGQPGEVLAGCALVGSQHQANRCPRQFESVSQLCRVETFAAVAAKLRMLIHWQRIGTTGYEDDLLRTSLDTVERIAGTNCDRSPARLPPRISNNTRPNQGRRISSRSIHVCLRLQILCK